MSGTQVPGSGFDDLLAYTDWQRDSWNAWFHREGPAALAVTTGDHSDGRFTTIGALVRHIFSAELRYAERILQVPVSDTGTVPADAVEPLFALGRSSRERLRSMINALPRDRWEVPFEFPLLNSTVRLSPRKVLLHVLTHEIRHWAQVATMLRLQGFKAPPQDLLFSPLPGGVLSL